MSETQPNILLIVVDQWRSDTLGCAGHPCVRTPHLDRLAADGVRFTNAYSATPTCVAARASLLTGLSQERHGIVGYTESVDWRYETTLAGTLADAGYHTQCVGKMHVKPYRNLMGFHNVVLHDGYLHTVQARTDDYTLYDDYLPDLRRRLGRPEADFLDSGIGCNGYAVAPWPYDESLHPTTWVTDQAVDFLHRRRDPSRPFFLKVSYHRPHPPLDPPASFLDEYRAIDPPEPVCGDDPVTRHDERDGVPSTRPADRDGTGVEAGCELAVRPGLAERDGRHRAHHPTREVVGVADFEVELVAVAPLVLADLPADRLG